MGSTFIFTLLIQYGIMSKSPPKSYNDEVTGFMDAAKDAGFEVKEHLTVDSIHRKNLKKLRNG